MMCSCKMGRITCQACQHEASVMKPLWSLQNNLNWKPKDDWHHVPDIGTCLDISKYKKNKQGNLEERKTWMQKYKSNQQLYDELWHVSDTPYSPEIPVEPMNSSDIQDIKEYYNTQCMGNSDSETSDEEASPNVTKKIFVIVCVHPQTRNELRI